ncbi:MAG: sensor histidine kinase [Chitinophagaceae bacterium]
MIRRLLLLPIFFTLSACFNYLMAQQDTLIFNKPTQEMMIGNRIWVQATDATTTIDALKWPHFRQSTQNIPVYGAESKKYWILFHAQNASNLSSLLLNIQFPNISNLHFYKLENKQWQLIDTLGTGKPFYSRSFNNPNFFIDLKLPPSKIGSYLIEIVNKNPLILPISITSKQYAYELSGAQNMVIGIYVGIMLAIFLYNLFLFFFTKDRSYLLYIFYIFFLGLAQVSISGYTYQFLWPTHPAFNNYSLVALSAIAGSTGIGFSMRFLALSKSYLQKALYFVIFLYISSIFLQILGFYQQAFQILNINALLGSILLIIAGILKTKQGYKPANYYLVAWSFFLIGIVVFALRNLSIIPYNLLTSYFSYTGSAAQGILLSIALANRINILRKEKEASQKAALEASEENARLVREQNIMLERKVTERTAALKESNLKLEETLTNLKDAQTQLVEAEKMASLGQLTAGIAHEINNPINFVKANITPLHQDIQDLYSVIEAYDALQEIPESDIKLHIQKVNQLKKSIDIEYVKDEITGLINGIKEGALRTAEIVSGLRTFSRLDESEVKIVDIHEGINSTLLLLKSKLNNQIEVVTAFNANGDVECYPGKLNQVFMNLLSNAIEAIFEKNDRTGSEKIYISTKDIDNQLEIRIKDTGPGVKKDIQSKIFDPFFTTKDVGKGTGLGLSIVYKIIQKHGGNIQINSEYQNGAEFIITLKHRLSA